MQVDFIHKSILVCLGLRCAGVGIEQLLQSIVPKLHQFLHILLPARRQYRLVPLQVPVPARYGFRVQCSQSRQALLAVELDVALEVGNADGGEAVGGFGEAFGDEHDVAGAGEEAVGLLLLVVLFEDFPFEFLFPVLMGEDVGELEVGKAGTFPVGPGVVYVFSMMCNGEVNR